MSKKPVIISVGSSKGGCGKSTITMLLASAIATHKKKSILVIDTDSQRTIADYYDVEKEGIETPLLDVLDLLPRQTGDFIDKFGKDYDLIFIDVPRMTDKKGDSATTILLSKCHIVLIPVVASQVDILSTLDFLVIINEIAKEKKEVGVNFKYAAFINKHNKRKENVTTLEFLKKQKVPTFKNHLSDLKIFTQPSLQESIMSTTQGKERFKPFYNEFLKTFKIK